MSTAPSPTLLQIPSMTILPIPALARIIAATLMLLGRPRDR
jgi:hypothetical protein